MTRSRTGASPHPIGTLAIVAAYGALFALGWLGMYLFVYLSRG